MRYQHQRKATTSMTKQAIKGLAVLAAMGAAFIGAIILAVYGVLMWIYYTTPDNRDDFFTDRDYEIMQPIEREEQHCQYLYRRHPDGSCDNTDPCDPATLKDPVLAGDCRPAEEYETEEPEEVRVAQPQPVDTPVEPKTNEAQVIK